MLSRCIRVYRDETNKYHFLHTSLEKCAEIWSYLSLSDIFDFAVETRFLPISRIEICANNFPKDEGKPLNLCCFAHGY